MERKTTGDGVYWFECQCGYSIGKPEPPVEIEVEEEKGEFKTEANQDLDEENLAVESTSEENLENSGDNSDGVVIEAQP